MDGLLKKEELQSLIDENIKIMRHIPKRYECLNTVFQNYKTIRKLYFQVMTFLKDKNLYYYRHKKTFHIDTETIEIIRNKKGSGTANRYINYLCAMGLFGKHIQTRHGTRTQINRNQIYKKPDYYRPVNTFSIFPYDENTLEDIEGRCKILIQKKIRPTNISKSKLVIAELPDLAKDLYPSVRNTMHWKVESCERIIEFLDEEIKLKGYSTKQEIINEVILNKKHNASAVQKILSQFELLGTNFHYGRPTKEQKSKYHLVNDSWIITKKEG